MAYPLTYLTKEVDLWESQGTTYTPALAMWLWQRSTLLTSEEVERVRSAAEIVAKEHTVLVKENRALAEQLGLVAVYLRAAPRGKGRSAAARHRILGLLTDSARDRGAFDALRTTVAAEVAAVLRGATSPTPAPGDDNSRLLAFDPKKRPGR